MQELTRSFFYSTYRTVRCRTDTPRLPQPVLQKRGTSGKRVASEAFLLARNGLNLPPNRKEEPSFPHSISIVALRLAGARLSWSGNLVWLAGAAAKPLLPPVW
jgi:hypothetical protein